MSEGIRVVRNFWHELTVAGRNDIATGPRPKDGGFSERISIRNGSESRLAVRLEGFVRETGELEIVVYDANGVEVYKVGGKR